MEPHLRPLFKKAAAHRLSVAEREQIYAELRDRIPPLGEECPPTTEGFLHMFYSHWQTSWIPLMLAIIFFLVGGASMTFAKSAVPGDLLYPLRRMGENFVVTWTFTPAEKAVLEDRHMNKHIDDAAKLEASGKLTDTAVHLLDQEYRRDRREVLRNVALLETEGNDTVASTLRARLNAMEDRYQRLFKGKRRETQTTAPVREAVSRQNTPSTVEQKAPAALKGASNTLQMIRQG